MEQDACSLFLPDAFDPVCSPANLMLWTSNRVASVDYLGHSPRPKLSFPQFARIGLSNRSMTFVSMLLRHIHHVFVVLGFAIFASSLASILTGPIHSHSWAQLRQTRDRKTKSELCIWLTSIIAYAWQQGWLWSRSKRGGADEPIVVDEPGVAKEAATTTCSADIGLESCENSEFFNNFMEKATAFDHRTRGDLHGPIRDLIGKVKHRKKLAREQRDGTSGRHETFREEARLSSPSTSTGPKRHPGLRELRKKASGRKSLQDLAHGGDARTSVQSNTSHKKSRWQERETIDSQSPEAAYLSQQMDNSSLDTPLSNHDRQLTTTGGSTSSTSLQNLEIFTEVANDQRVLSPCDIGGRTGRDDHHQHQIDVGIPAGCSTSYLSSQFRPRQAPQLSTVSRRNFKKASTSNVGRSADQGARVSATSRMRITSDEFRRQAFIPKENVLPQFFSPKISHIKGLTAFGSTNRDQSTVICRDDDEEEEGSSKPLRKSMMVYYGRDSSRTQLRVLDHTRLASQQAPTATYAP